MGKIRTSSNLSPTWIPAFSDGPPSVTREMKTPYKEIKYFKPI